MSTLAIVILAMSFGAIMGSHVAHMLAGGILALILFHPQAQELREILVMSYEKASPELIRAATEVLQKP
jgi:hypothetical protein